MHYNIGQIITANQDIHAKRAITDEEVTIPKGSKAIIGPDNMAYLFEKDNAIMPISNDITVAGYDTAGLAEYLVAHLKRYFPLSDMLFEHCFNEKEFQDEIEYALDDIGF